jgi:hypothetical protein
MQENRRNGPEVGGVHHYPNVDQTGVAGVCCELCLCAVTAVSADGPERGRKLSFT